MKIHPPKGWRYGQMIFNFLEWLRVEKGYPGVLDLDYGEYKGRMADPFHIEDEKFQALMTEYQEYLYAQVHAQRHGENPLLPHCVVKPDSV